VSHVKSDHPGLRGINIGNFKVRKAISMSNYTYQPQCTKTTVSKSLLVLHIIGYGSNKNTTLHMSKGSLVLLLKPLVREIGGAELLCPGNYQSRSL